MLAENFNGLYNLIGSIALTIWLLSVVPGIGALVVAFRNPENAQRQRRLCKLATGFAVPVALIGVALAKLMVAGAILLFFLPLGVALFGWFFGWASRREE